MPKSGGTIYAIGAQGTSWVKIGCTTTAVHKRLKLLQTGQPFPLEVVATVEVESDLQRIERQVHAFLADAQRRGEWFEVPMDRSTLEGLIVPAVQYIHEEEQRKRAARERPLPAAAGDRTVRQIFGDRVRHQRMALGLSQTDLAERTAIPYQVLSRVEHGKQSIYVDRLVELANALDVSTDYLLGRTDDPTPPTRRRRSRRVLPDEPEGALALAGAWEKTGMGA